MKSECGVFFLLKNNIMPNNDWNRNMEIAKIFLPPKYTVVLFTPSVYIFILSRDARKISLHLQIK